MADKLTNSLVAEAKEEGQLSPNPSGFGFTKQVKVDSLPDSGQRFDTLYILPDGRKFKWTQAHTWEQVLNDGTPAVKSVNGQVAPNTQVNTPATPAFEKIFNGDVGFNGKVFIEGKEIKLKDVDGKVPVDEIDAENSTAGQVIVSKGDGTAEWGDGLLIYEFAGTTKIIDAVKPRPYILKVSSVYYLARIIRPASTIVEFEIERNGTGNSLSKDRWAGSVQNGNNTALSDILSVGSSWYKPYLEAPAAPSTGKFALKSNNGTPAWESPLDSDVQVEISTDGGSTYADAISLDAFIARCETGNIYTTVGIIARISHCINGATIRFRLIGLNHDVLANTDAGELEPSGTTAKTTWQFLDIPVQKVNLGLPYDAQDFDTVSDFAAEDDYYAYPSNKHGYSSATGLLDALHSLFESLPLSLQKAMKLVRKDCYIPRITHSDDISAIQDNSTADYIVSEADRYGSCVAQKLFCLSAAEVGCTDNDNFPLTVTINEGEENEETINLEGHKYSYFEEGSGETALAKRICYYGGEAYYYWLRSPFLTVSNGWAIVVGNGVVNSYSAYDGSGLAPAFCI